MGGEDWKSFVRIAVRPWEGQLNFLSVEFPLMIRAARLVSGSLVLDLLVSTQIGQLKLSYLECVFESS